MYSVLLLLTFFPLLSSAYLHPSKLASTSSLPSLHITTLSTNVMFHGDACLILSINLFIIIANKKGLRLDFFCNQQLAVWPWYQPSFEILQVK
ncbi:hypothetical protein SK128_022781, partial [Halocaridina rubra]